MLNLADQDLASALFGSERRHRHRSLLFASLV